jgi:hypothetical protein
MEDGFDMYMEDYSQRVEDDGEGAKGNFVQLSNTAEFPYQQPYYDYGPSASSSREPDYDHANDDPPSWSDYPHWD